MMQPSKLPYLSASVVYVDPDNHPRAAIVIRIDNETIVTLVYFVPSLGNERAAQYENKWIPIALGLQANKVEFSEDGKAGTWSWPSVGG